MPTWPTVAAKISSSVNVTERGVSPPTITFKKGDSVTWIDQDATAHRLIISSEPTGEELQGFGTDEPISKGESYSFRLRSQRHIYLR